MKERIKAIPTKYREVTFRSRMEATFAIWCDQNRFKWVYEPEGLTNGRQRYLPDFLLPDSKMLVEIKPAIVIAETSKLDMFFESDGFDDYALVVIEMNNNRMEVLQYAAPAQHGCRSGWAIDEEIYLVGVCYRCRSFLINAQNDSWMCPGCGFYDGDETIVTLEDDPTRSRYVTR
jgi:hypothetical protein